jgi:hypothetical protein
MLVRLADGEVLCIFREAKWRGYTIHHDPTTRTSLVRSRDRGRTWFSQVSPDPAGGNGTSIGRLSDGTLLGNDFHWVFAPPAGGEPLAGMPHRQYVERLDMWVAAGGVFTVRSRTDGYTWDAPVRVPAPDGWPQVSCAGRVIELPDGDLLLPLSAKRDGVPTSHSVVLRSGDGGETWGDAVWVTADGVPGSGCSETRLVLCPSGRVLAMHRNREGNYFQNVSADGGRTWSATTDSGTWCGGSSPPDLMVLTDGRVLLTRGYRREPYGVRCHISEDDGATWGREVILREDGPDRDVGYPSTIQFDDGELLTVYYWHGDDGIRHLQRTNWTLEE